jgi:HlyD family secretion protein
MESRKLSSELATLRIERRTDDGLRSTRRWSYAAAGAIAAVLLMVGVIVAVWKAAPRLLVVRTGVVRPAMAPAAGGDLTAAGHVVPEHTARIGSRVTGRIAKVSVVEGEMVSVGRVLFELETDRQRRVVAVAVAQTDLAQARVAAAKAELNETRNALERAIVLAQGNAVARSVVEDLQAKAQSGMERVKVAGAEAREKAAELAVARGELDDYTIVSPLAGVAISKPLGVGNVVDPSSTLVELAEYASMRLEIDVPEARLGSLRLNQKAEIILDAFRDRRISGHLSDIMPRIDRAKATATVRVRFVESPDIPGTVRPDMAARVRFTAQDPPEKERATLGVWAPSSAVTERGGQRVVFVIEAGRARQVFVEIGDVDGNELEIKRGLALGARVVLEPPASLSDAQPIEETKP